MGPSGVDPAAERATAEARGILPAASRLGEGERSVRYLAERLHSDDPAVRSAAATALGVIGGDGAMQALRWASLDSDPDTAAAAALARWRLGDEAARGEAGAQLIERLQSSDAASRGLAARALGALRVPDSVEPLMRALSDVSTDVRLDAAGALGRLGDARAAYALAFAAFNDADPRVRAEAMDALHSIVAMRH